jgi:hypothetical protein
MKTNERDWSGIYVKKGLSPNDERDASVYSNTEVEILKSTIPTSNTFVYVNRTYPEQNANEMYLNFHFTTETGAREYHNFINQKLANTSDPVNVMLEQKKQNGAIQEYGIRWVLIDPNNTRLEL